MRSDVSAEIRSTIEDMLEDRSADSGRPPDEVVLGEILRDYGSPDQVAANYLPEKYLVGPQLYPLFTMVLKIVFAVLTVLALVGLGIGLSAGQAGLEGIIKTIGSSIANYYTILITAFGNIVLVFAVLQRVLPAAEQRATDPRSTDWDPAELTQAPSPNEARPWEQVVSILFNFAALLIFNFYPQLLSYTSSLNDPGSGAAVWISIFSQEFYSYLPWLNLLWILQIGLSLVLLRSRRWTVGSRLISIALKLIWIGIAIAMLRGPALLNLSNAALSAWPEGLEGIRQLASFGETVLRIILGLSIFGSFVGIIQELVKIFRYQD